MDEERSSPENTIFVIEEKTDAQLPAVLPEPPPISDFPETAGPSPQNPQRGRSIFRTVLSRILPSVLLSAAVTVYAVLAVTSVPEHDITVTHFLQFVLGEFTGGAEYVRFTETTAELSPETPETSLLPSELPDETETVPFTPDFPLYRLDMSSSAPDALGLINETPYEPDLNALADAGRAIPSYAQLAQTYGTDAPVVLILHTHTTEAFADTHADNFRSTDSSRSVIAVGAVIAERLAENGIPVLHCTEIFDSPDFNMAYYNAALAVRQYTADYPSVSYVIDVHRDSIVSGDGWVSPVTETDGKSAAQMMFVVGTDHGGSGHTGWKDNLALAVRLQKRLHADCPSLMRDINLRSASFNEQYTSGSLLLEIGSCASTLEEAKNAAELFADALIAEILG